MDIRIERTKNPGVLPPADRLGFGRVFSDHMFLMEYDAPQGWHDARIVPFGNLSIHPASTVFHYGAEIFEGLKAYRRSDGSIQLFRPEENFRRMNNSAERMCLPLLNEADALEALETLVRLDSSWVPSEPGTSLYLRPFIIGNDEYLGVHAVNSAVFCIICSPSGSYYTGGLAPVSIMIEDRDVRAVRGGTGYAKCGGNYGASFRAGKLAEEKGYSQVLWLDGVERKYIEEVGAMNVMFKFGDEIATPMLNGSILPGVTRKSIIELMAGKGVKINERLISLDELERACADGTLTEAWGCGTAAVVSPIGKLVIHGREYVINNNTIGPLTQSLYDELTGIQWGTKPDPFGWTVTL